MEDEAMKLFEDTYDDIDDTEDDYLTEEESNYFGRTSSKVIIKSWH